jgi:hypothetical protein
MPLAYRLGPRAVLRIVSYYYFETSHNGIYNVTGTYKQPSNTDSPHHSHTRCTQAHI